MLQDELFTSESEESDGFFKKKKKKSKKVKEMQVVENGITVTGHLVTNQS